jgi:large subunit ribosomal protein L24e
MADKCSFCGNDIEPGTGTLYVKKDGSTYYFCSAKCKKNLLKLGRDAKRVRWTQHFRKGEK